MPTDESHRSMRYGKAKRLSMISMTTSDNLEEDCSAYARRFNLLQLSIISFLVSFPSAGIVLAIWGNDNRKWAVILCNVSCSLLILSIVVSYSLK